MIHNIFTFFAFFELTNSATLRTRLFSLFDFLHQNATFTICYVIIILLIIIIDENFFYLIWFKIVMYHYYYYHGIGGQFKYNFFSRGYSNLTLFKYL